MTALNIVMRNFADVLEWDTWRAYVYMPCPNPEMHAATGCCYDCENKYVEFEE